MGVSEFYDTVRANLVDKLRYISNNQFPSLGSEITSGVKNNLISAHELNNSYKEKDPVTNQIIYELSNKVLELWPTIGPEHTRIFSYYTPNYQEHQLIDSLSLIIFGRERFIETENYKSEIRLPDILKELIKSEHIIPDEIIPALKQTYPTQEECVIYYEHSELRMSRFDPRITKFRINSQIHQRIIDQFLLTPTGNTQLIKRPKGKYYDIDIDDLENKVKINATLADKPDIPLNGFGAALKLDPETFLYTYYFELGNILNIKFPEHITAEKMLESKGETFFKGTLNYSKEDEKNYNEYLTCAIALHPEHTLLIINAPNEYVAAFDNDIGLKLFAAKQAVEKYCALKGISIYTENIISDENKLILYEKIITRQERTNLLFSITEHKKLLLAQHFPPDAKPAKLDKKQALTEITNSISQNSILKIIDFSNNTNGFSAQVTDTYNCSCGKNIIEGRFYYANHGLTWKQSQPILSINSFSFSLSQLHKMLEHPKTYSPKIHEPKIIIELLNLSQKWHIYTTPAGIEKELFDVIIAMKQRDLASSIEDKWIGDTHSSIDATEEEMEVDPQLKADVLFEREIFAEPDKIIKSVQPQIEKIITAYEKEHEKLPDELTDSCNDPHFRNNTSAILAFEASFIEHQYNTFLAETAFNPTPERLEIVQQIKRINTPIDLEINEIRDRTNFW